VAEQVPFEMTPAEVKRRLDAGEKLFLIDVREQNEYATARIPGSELIPMNTVPAALTDLEGKDDQGTIVVFCHHGMRSANVTQWLRGQGLRNVASMSGGIDQWSTDVDPSVPRY
jgi:rhodanese-related sulfurtransferase